MKKGGTKYRAKVASECPAAVPVSEDDVLPATHRGAAADLLGRIGCRLMRQRRDLLAWLSSPESNLTSDRGLRVAALLNDTEGRLIELANAVGLSPTARQTDARLADLERAVRELEFTVATVGYLSE